MYDIFLFNGSIQIRKINLVPILDSDIDKEVRRFAFEHHESGSKGPLDYFCVRRIDPWIWLN